MGEVIRLEQIRTVRFVVEPGDYAPAWGPGWACAACSSQVAHGTRCPPCSALGVQQCTGATRAGHQCRRWVAGAERCHQHGGADARRTDLETPNTG